MAASAQYGYQPQKLGYSYTRPSLKQPGLSPRSLALAASGTTSALDPYGLGTIPQPGQPLIDGGITAPKAAATPKPPAAQPQSVPGSPTAPTAPAGSATTGGATFDINTDPALQSTNALLGLNDDQARAQALGLKEQTLLDYGDPTLAAAELGQNDPFVLAAANNPTSTLAQLRQARDRGTTDRTEAYNKNNLFYSGARVQGEQQAGQDYQNQLAQAAAQVGGSLSGINSNLLAALSQSNLARASALRDAYANNKTQAGVDPTAAAQATAPDTLNYGGASIASANPDDPYWKLIGLARAAGGNIAA